MKQVLLKVSEDVKLTTHTEYLKETCLGKEQWNEQEMELQKDRLNFEHEKHEKETWLRRSEI